MFEFKSFKEVYEYSIVFGFQEEKFVGIIRIRMSLSMIILRFEIIFTEVGSCPIGHSRVCIGGLTHPRLFEV